MQGCLLRVNNLPVTSVRLRPKDEGFDVYMEDPTFGEFPISRSCLLEFLDLEVPRAEREQGPAQGWVRVTYDELLGIIQRIQNRRSESSE